MAKTSQSGPEILHTLVSVLRCILCFQRITFLRTYLMNVYQIYSYLLKLKLNLRIGLSHRLVYSFIVFKYYEKKNTF